MAVVYDLVRNHELYCADVNQPVFEVVSSMVEHNIGAVPVLRNGKLAGIFSERDLMKRVVAAGRDAHQTRVAEVMTADPVVVAPDQSLEACLELMKRHGFRHLPVSDGKKVHGLVSLRDLLAHAVVEKDGEVQAMRAYITQGS